MKHLIRTIVLVITFTAPMAASAQPPPGEPPPLRERHENGKPPFRPASPLQQWMHQLAESDPEEFQRLQDLRMKDPEAFRQATREKLTEHGLKRLQTARPAVYDAIINLPEEDREWLADRLLNPNMGPPPDRPGRDGKGPRRDKESGIDHTLIRAYKKAETEEEKSAARDQIRATLSTLYDQQLAQRREQLTDAEKKLETIRKTIELGESGKDAFIEEKLSLWLNHADNKGKRPKPPGEL